ncbi:plant UBX domain-containing protein 11 [Impatiens glandulifera]|uniref:plant UBX domain-containing protein 11 n=1 Tax=Impatiens glandulifera TaxID=253017 RepID=UPI001FB0BB09|nr:plant UBX domain-containing protein 11 [Impatiens glandulifera]XP_047334365.1 plant UBX domain-containing protein 11 [Impatiens glandulifera]
MERSVNLLAYKGSIIEAITESKRQKKLFVVYISGDNSESISLEESTWLDSKVEDVILKYCILLHIRDGSTDATQFSAIYPQRPAPCITAIGYNGIQLWQNEGFLIADVLASSLEKAWLSLHIQETFLTVALASNKSEPHDTLYSNSLPIEQGSSSTISTSSTDTNLALSSDNGVISSSDHAVDDASPEPTVLKGSSASNDKVKEEQNQKPLKENQSEASSAPTFLNKSNASNEKEKDQQKLQKENQNKDQAGCSVGNARAECQTSRENTEVADQQSAAREVEVKNETLEDTLEVKSTDVHFNIRLPNGSNIREKFLVEDTLRMVKDYVDENQTSAISSYDLAIPYPRRVFSSHDLSRTLSELGLFGRQALVMVPHIRSTDDHKGGSSSEKYNRETTSILDSSNETSGGSWAVVKNMFSYINPLSYIGGGGASSSSTSGQESQSSSMWQYSPNPSLLHESRQTTTPTATGRATTTNNTQNGRTPSRFGGNIHTLRHDEDDDTNFNNKNTFWNGNSTQYGGGGGDDNPK